MRTWLDRPLSLAGKIVVRGEDAFNPEIRLVDFQRPLVTIPSLAIHMDREVNDEGKLVATRPTFGGNLMANILCKNYPQMATVRPKVLKISDCPLEKNTEFITINSDVSNIEKDVEIVDFIPNIQLTDTRIDEAEIIVAGGKGMKTKEG